MNHKADTWTVLVDDPGVLIWFSEAETAEDGEPGNEGLLG
jgi:hypothetical protein